MPAIVTRASKRDVTPKPEPVAAPPANDARKSAIVTVRKRGKLAYLLADITPEESNRRADAADAMFQDMKRWIAEKGRS